MLLQRAMEEHGFKGGRFLIDGFPRNLENLNTWEKLMGDKVEVPFILHLVCSEEVMLSRLLKRGETSGRSDDNIESIKKRFRTYNEETMEIITHFDGLKKNRDVNSEREVGVIFSEIEGIFKASQLIWSMDRCIYWSFEGFKKGKWYIFVMGLLFDKEPQ